MNISTPTSTPQSTKGPFDLVALATSAGGLNALTQVLAGLPSGFPAAIVVVQHLAPEHESLMVELLSRRLVLPVRWAKDGDHLQGGMIDIAPPAHHLLVNPNGTLTLDQSPRVNFGVLCTTPQKGIVHIEIAKSQCDSQ